MLAFFGPITGPVAAAPITLVCLDLGRAVDACRAGAERFAEGSGHEVRVVAADATGRRSLERLLALFSVDSPSVDVIQFADGWAPALADHLTTVPAEDAIPPSLESARVRGRLVGIPHHLAVTVVFLRNDVVGGPVSDWSALKDQLLKAPADGTSGLSFGAADPALFPFFVDWLNGAGTRLGDREGVAAALTALQDVFGAVAVPGVASLGVRDAVAEFTDGNSAALVTRSTRVGDVRRSDVADRVAPAQRVSVGEAQAPVLVSTWHLGVSRHSAEQEAALALATFLTTEAEQRKAAIAFGLAPTRAALYEDAAVLRDRPVFSEIARLLPAMVPPPLTRFGANYLDTSDAVSEAVRGFLRGEMDAGAAASAIVRAVRRGERVGVD
ncbi:MAG: extracellular solute-binding protein [Pseudomonadota bacterium]